jgi:hypothetical protein
MQVTEAAACWLCAQDLIKQLLRQDPERRLGNLAGGAADIKVHPFFAGVDWDALLSSAPLLSPCWGLCHDTCMAGLLSLPSRPARLRSPDGGVHFHDSMQALRAAWAFRDLCLVAEAE